VKERNLKQLRLDIRSIDSELVRLLGKRLELARQICSLKLENGISIVDQTVEKAVVENFVNSAIGAGVDPEFAKQIARFVIEESVEVQMSLQTSRTRSSETANVAVLGAGAMGSWFAKFFRSRGNSVIVTDIDPRRSRSLAAKINVRSVSSNTEAVRSSDIVVLATPANVVSKVVKEILPHLREETLLLDISAVKSASLPVLHMAEKKGIRFVSIHPMFGPPASSIWKKNVVVLQTGDHRSTLAVKRMLEGARIVDADPAEHDRQTAMTLALPHFLNMLFAMTISGRSLAKARKFAGRTFELQMLLAHTVGREPQTTADIIILNKEFRSILRDLMKNALLLAEVVNKHDRARLISFHKRIQRYLSSDPKLGIVESAFEKASDAISTRSAR
jgi:prephenate dehydrogenase/chorismate mutase